MMDALIQDRERIIATLRAESQQAQQTLLSSCEAASGIGQPQLESIPQPQSPPQRPVDDSLPAESLACPRRTARCLEIGSGSGILICTLAKLFDRRAFCTAIDVNPKACEATRQTMIHNQIQGDVLQSNLISALHPRLTRQCFDVLLFNPPYVPTDASEMQGDALQRSWAGGKDGREITDQLLPLVQQILAPAGLFYCVLLSSNKIPLVRELMRSNDYGSFESEIVLSRRAGPEHLSIVRFQRKSSHSEKQ